MHLIFYLDDNYEPHTYDTKVANDVTLYIFKDNRLTYSNIIPYSEIAGGKEYVLRKTPEISGNIELIAWAVPPHRDLAFIPEYRFGDLFDDLFKRMEVDLSTRAETRYKPLFYDIHMGNATSVEAIDEPTRHMINMLYAPCRVEVRLHDQLGAIDVSQPDKPPYVLVHGVMSQMNLRKQGTGEPAVVNVPLICSDVDDERYHTGRFGVLPSSEGQIVSVQIISLDNVVTTLTVPTNTLPKGAYSGGLLIFDYTIGETYFYIEIDGWTIRIQIVEGI